MISSCSQTGTERERGAAHVDKTLRILHFDIVNTWKTITFLFAFFFLFGMYYGLIINNLLVIPFSILIWVAMMAGFPYALRDKYGLDKLMAAFPINRRMIVRSRFLLCILIGFLGTAMAEIMVCTAAGIFHVGFVMREMYFALILSFLLYTLILAVHMPLYFYFTNTQMIQVSPVFVYFIYVIVIQLYYTGVFNIDLGPVISLAWRYGIGSLLITLVLAAALHYLSYVITFRIYRNKDL
jgi:hypothetical protein